MEAITDIPFELDTEALCSSARIDPESGEAAEFLDLVARARKVARPKALYKEAYIEETAEDTVTVDGVVFTSRALRKNLDGVRRVFPYVATCGGEVDQIDLPDGDLLSVFWLDGIKAALLGVSICHLTRLLDRKYGLEKTANMSPGSGDASVWPIQQQRELFSLFGDVEKLIGVRLTDSFLMLPNKTVSGIRFPTEIDFQSCQLCRRENCVGRRAPFDRELWESVQHG